MLWTKAWLETRWRFLFSLAIPVFALITRHSKFTLTPADVPRMLNSGSVLYAFAGIYLGGSGIQTQSSFRETRGLHVSTIFTLTLPVSRLRLLAVRAIMGLLETGVVIAIGICLTWMLYPLVRANSTPFDLLKLIIAVFAYATGFHFFSVLLATFLDAVWQLYGSMLSIGVLWGLTALLAPQSLNVFRIMTTNSPLATHVFPWAAVSVSCTLAVVFFLAAARVVKTREY